MSSLVRCLNVTNMRVRAPLACRNEDGNVLLFGLGLACVALVLLLGLVQVGSVYSTKRDLAFLADSAALVYSDTQESNSYFELIENAHGAPAESRESATETAENFLTDAAAAKELSGVSVAFSYTTDGTLVEVTHTKKYTFLSGIADGFTISVTLLGVATAQNYGS